MSFLAPADYVIYNEETGVIIGFGQTQVGAIVHMRLLGQTVLEGYGRPDTHHVDLATMQIVAGLLDEPQLSLDLEPGE